MAKRKTIPWDAADYLKTDDAIANYLEAVFDDGDPALITAALGDVARAKGMSQVAQAAASAREPVQGAFAGGQSGICHGVKSRACTRPQAQSRGVKFHNAMARARFVQAGRAQDPPYEIEDTVSDAPGLTSVGEAVCLLWSAAL